jgi:hypothetical protein
MGENRKEGITTKRKNRETHKMESNIYGKIDGGKENKIGILPARI